MNNNNVESKKMINDNDQESKVTGKEPEWLADLNRIGDLNTWRAGIEDSPTDTDTELLVATVSRLFIAVKKEYENVLTDFTDRCYRDYKDPDYSMLNHYAQFNHEVLEVLKKNKLKRLNVKVTSLLVHTKFKDGSLGVGITVKTVCKHDIDDIYMPIEATEVAVDVLSMILRSETISDDGYMVMQMNATLNERLEAEKNTDLGAESKYMNNWIRMIRVKDEVEFGDTCYGAACRIDGDTLSKLNGQIAHITVYEEDEHDGRYVYDDYDVVVNLYLPTNTTLDPNKQYRISCRIFDLEDNDVVHMWYENV